MCETTAGVTTGAAARYCVIDLETTGLSPQHSRIIEIAAVQLDENLQEIAAWNSLISPFPPGAPLPSTLGAQWIHGITPADLLGKPQFSACYSELISLLSGTVIVGHNIKFDCSFLNAEFARSGSPLFIPATATACTLDSSYIYCPPGPHSLGKLCARLEIEIPHAHRALDDARATAELLRIFAAKEARGERYTNSAINRQHEEVQPCAWEKAQAWIPPAQLPFI
ncbi:PolC-type DNA polymerase III [Arcanobacterium urinimassiliense]|uniref:3'-5' exonuclease n=1 Tax=Arcanobacterium urinimassiliense TaxID=1871014 RepID=UPI00093BE5B4|nr:3'-5' exonuclease [Arcanobacterium urinimassiliense]